MTYDDEVEDRWERTSRKHHAEQHRIRREAPGPAGLAARLTLNDLSPNSVSAGPEHELRPLGRRPTGVDAALRRPRVRLVTATLARKRSAHTELRVVPTLKQLRAVTKRDGIELGRLPGASARRGMAMRALGVTVIGLAPRLSREARRCVLVHEMAHAWLHLEDPVTMAWRAEQFRSPYACRATSWSLDQRSEEEADLLGAALLQLPLSVFRSRQAACPAARSLTHKGASASVG
jgi:hypothetical protein